MRAMSVAVAVGVTLAGCTASYRPQYLTSGELGERQSAERAGTPGVRVGERAPDARLWTSEGEELSLASLYGEGPLVLVFYRGGWCPYCGHALSDLDAQLGAIQRAGGRLVAISPESPQRAAQTSAEHGIRFALLSDFDHEASRAFGVHFEVDEETRETYLGYGIDVADWNQARTWELPAPATYVVDSAGVVRYAFADWDYTRRADPAEVVEAVRRAD